MTSRKTVLLVGIEPTLIDFSEPDYAAFPGMNAQTVLAGLEAARQALASLGYDVEMCGTDFGETAAAVLAERLRQKPFDCVLVGAGVRVVPRHLLLFETLLNVIHEHAPQAKICFNSRPADTAEAVQRWA